MTLQAAFYATGTLLMLLILATFVTGIAAGVRKRQTMRCPQCRGDKLARVRVVDASTGFTLHNATQVICRDCLREFDESEALRE